jgi:hypothetical protein
VSGKASVKESGAAGVSMSGSVSEIILDFI